MVFSGINASICVDAWSFYQDHFMSLIGLGTSAQIIDMANISDQRSGNLRFSSGIRSEAAESRRSKFPNSYMVLRLRSTRLCSVILPMYSRYLDPLVSLFIPSSGASIEIIGIP